MKRLSRARAMKAKCLECINFEMIDCRIPSCPLYPWRPYKDKDAPHYNLWWEGENFTDKQRLRQLCAQNQRSDSKTCS